MAVRQELAAVCYLGSAVKTVISSSWASVKVTVTWSTLCRTGGAQGRSISTLTLRKMVLALSRAPLLPGVDELVSQDLRQPRL